MVYLFTVQFLKRNNTTSTKVDDEKIDPSPVNKNEKQPKEQHVKPNRRNAPKSSSRITPNRLGTSSPLRSKEPKGKHFNNSYSSYNDPDSLCGVVFVENKFISKILYHW